MAFLASLLHLLWMTVTVVPYTLAILIVRALGGHSRARYRIARAWLKLSVDAARWFIGIRTRVAGMEHLPTDPAQGVVLLVKHQSTYETFLMPAIMPRPLAYVFKRELLRIPFFGWSIGSLDMIHIDRGQRAEAFGKVLAQGRRLLAQGTWVIMFPEGTRAARGERGQYKSGGARLAIEAGVPVVPIAVTSAKVWPRKAFVKRPGTVDVSIGRAIPTTGRSPDELMREVEAWIEGEMRRLDPDAYAASGAPAHALPGRAER
ncbi:lysophospholipid acyltransferase family protein [Acidovorax sp. FG27]|uniref:lysophospholipid acyltransferase family protein n=1 Tax=Acidovorax sp. FG27 TaxID=3133652 RepID=UPI0030E797EC